MNTMRHYQNSVGLFVPQEAFMAVLKMDEDEPKKK